MYYDKKWSRLVGQITFPDTLQSVETILHCPLPDGMQLIKTSAGKLLPDHSGIRFAKGQGSIHFEAIVRKSK
jgi:hypothetical protein